MKKIEIDPVVYGWCRSHGLSVLDPEAEVEFGIWCAEINAFRGTAVLRRSSAGLMTTCCSHRRSRTLPYKERDADRAARA